MTMISKNAYNEYAKGNFVDILVKDTVIEAIGWYRFLGLSLDGIYLFKERPVFENGFWVAKESSKIAEVNWLNDTPKNVLKCKSSLFELDTNIVHDVNKLALRMGFSAKSLETLVETNESVIKDSKGKEFDIPDEYKYVAVDANGDIKIHQSKPEINDKEYPNFGEGKKIGVAVWNWKKLKSQPKNFEESFKEVKELMPKTLIELKDEVNVTDLLNKLGFFKVVFLKYNSIVF